MTKQEFIQELQECLEGQITSEELLDTVNYYQDYIREEEMKGRTEEEIFTSLGSPRLIAHSILDAHEEAVNGSAGGYYDAEDETYREEGHVPATDQMRMLATRIGAIAIIVTLAIVGIMVIHTLLPVILIIVVLTWLFRLMDGR